MTRTMTRAEQLQGLLLGTAVGDSLGLPLEGLSPRRAQRLFPGEIRQRLLPGTGLISDDTEHTILVALALLQQPTRPEQLARQLGWGLRWWLLALPAGVGLATLRATLKLWLGVPPQRSGVFSAGNGPAMRVALIGVHWADDPTTLTAMVAASTRITHRDPRALVGALAVARVAAAINQQLYLRPRQLLALLRACGDQDQEWRGRLALLAKALRGHHSPLWLAQRYGLERGVSGYVYHTVPMAIYCWYHHRGDYRSSLSAVLALGGDSDTVGAITGALVGLEVGENGIPESWLHGLRDWPRGQRFLRQLGEALAHGQPPPQYCWPLLPLRNLLFLLVVLSHGLRRLAPPY